MLIVFDSLPLRVFIFPFPLLLIIIKAIVAITSTLPASTTSTKLLASVLALVLHLILLLDALISSSFSSSSFSADSCRFLLPFTLENLVIAMVTCFRFPLLMEAAYLDIIVRELIIKQIDYFNFHHQDLQFHLSHLIRYHHFIADFITIIILSFLLLSFMPRVTKNFIFELCLFPYIYFMLLIKCLDHNFHCDYLVDYKMDQNLYYHHHDQDSFIQESKDLNHNFL